MLTNGVIVEGTFGGKWLKRVEIQKAVLEDPVVQEDHKLPGPISKELQYVCMFPDVLFISWFISESRRVLVLSLVLYYITIHSYSYL